MSRVAKNPVKLPKGVAAHIDAGLITIKGSRGTLSRQLPPGVLVAVNSDEIAVSADLGDKAANALAGTTRANINNMVNGVHAGYEKRLTLVGVGYRAVAKGDVLSLTLGYSHPVEFKAPAGIVIETPSQTDILVKGCDKQQVGQVAADIRAYRAPEPYKGKGVRYAAEEIVRKEAKKK